MERTVTTCDVPPCTKTKGEGNGWLRFLDGYRFVIRAIDEPHIGGEKDCCSQTCLMKAMQDWLQKQRETPKELPIQKGE